MATPPAFVAAYGPTSQTSSSSSSAAITVAAGDLLLLWAGTGAGDRQINTPTGGTGITWTLVASPVTTGDTTKAWLAMWRATVTTAQTFTCTLTTAGAGTESWGWQALRFSGQGAAGAVASTSNGGSAPSLNITTTAVDSLVVVAVNDFNVTAGSGRTYRTAAGAFTESRYSRGANTTLYAGYHADVTTPGTYAVGLTAPTGELPAMIAIEIRAQVAAALTATATTAASVTGTSIPGTAAVAQSSATVTGSQSIASAVSAVARSSANAAPIQNATVAATASSSAAIVGTAAPHPTPPPLIPVTSSDPYRSGYQVTYTIDATLNGSPVAGATGLAPTGGTVTDTTKPGVRRTLDVDLPPTPGLYDLLKPAGTRLTVTAYLSVNRVPWKTVPMGVYVVTAPALSEGGGKISVTAPDKWQLIVRAGFIVPTGSTPGIPVTAQIAALIRGALGQGEPVVITATSTAVMGTQTWTEDRAQAILDLAQSIGAWVFFDRNGVATIADVPTIAGNADWLADASPSGVLIELDRSAPTDNTFNVVAVTSSSSGGELFPGPVYLWDSDPTSPTYAGPDPLNSPELAGPFGISVTHIPTPTAATLLEAQAAGSAVLAKTVGAASQVSFSMAPNPEVDAFDAIDVMPPRQRYDIPRVLERHIADTVTYHLDVDQPMHIDGRSTRSAGY